MPAEMEAASQAKISRAHCVEILARRRIGPRARNNSFEHRQQSSRSRRDGSFTATTPPELESGAPTRPQNCKDWTWNLEPPCSGVFCACFSMACHFGAIYDASPRASCTYLIPTLCVGLRATTINDSQRVFSSPYTRRSES